MYKLSAIAALTLTTVLSANLWADTLEEVVITSKSNQSLMDTAGSITVITAEEIEKSNANSIKDVLVGSAGIVLSANDSSISGRQSISIRGTQSKHVLILVDGKKVSGSDAQVGHSDFQYNWVPMNAIERIEVIKGPMSAIYGSQAIGGVINIITKKSEKTFYGDVDVKIGLSSDKGGDSKDISVNLGGKITPKLSVNVSAQRKDLDVTVDKNSSTTTKIEGKEIVNGLIKFAYDIDDTQDITVSYSAGKEDRWKVQDTLYYDIKRKSYDLGYSKRFEDITLDLDYYVTDSDIHYNSSNSYTHNMTDTVVKAEVSIASIDDNYIVTGIESKKEAYNKVYDSSASSGSNFKNEIKNNSLFIQDEIEIGDDFIFTIGGRYDNHEKFEGEFSPKANLVYKLSPNQRIKFGYAEGFSAPTVTQNSSSYVSTSHFIFMGNDDLKPETSKSFDISYEWFSEDTTFKTSIYKTNVKDLIATSLIATSTYQYTNVDQANMQGLEAELTHTFDENNDIRISYNFLKTEDESDGSELSFKPKHSANIRVNSKLSWDINSTVSANYTGTQTDGTDKFGGYTLLNFQLSKKISNVISARVGVDNLMNKDLSDQPYDIKGRLAYVGLNFKF